MPESIATPTTMNGSTPHRHSPQPAWMLAASAVVLCAIQILILVPNHDNAWLIELSVRMLNGGKYYTDFFELNPPLYPILLLPVDLMSRATGIAPYPIFIAYVSALIFYVSRQFAACLPSLPPGATPGARMLLALCIQACLFLFPGYDFGQRDHVAICLILPLLCYFVMEQSSGQVTHQAMIAAVCAALGVLIKPFLAGTVLLLLAVRIAATRRVFDLLWPVVVPAAAVAAGYILLVWSVFPEWLVMARIAGEDYSMYAVHQWLPGWTVSALALIAVLAVANESWQSSATARWGVRYLLATTAGALLSYVLQHKGFSYHLAPVKIMLGLTLAVLGIVVLARPARELLWAPAALLAIIILMAGGEEARSLRAQQRARDDYQQLAARLTDLQAGHRLFFFSTSLSPEFPLNLYYPFTPSSRFPCLWTLPAAVVRGESPTPAGQGAELSALVAQDFRRWQPTAFLVDESTYKQAVSQPFDFLPWFQRDPDLRHLLEQYQLAGRYSGGAPHHWRFAIYVRRQPATARN